MPRPRKKERIVCPHFSWLLGTRGDVYFADGRSNEPPLGRHSLATKDYGEALNALKQLDLVMAVKAGRVDRAALDQPRPEMLPLEKGHELYRAHVARPRVTGGAKASTSKRYRPVFEKFFRFAREQGVTVWNQVSTRLVESYAAYLDDEGYAYATEYLELTTLKQAVKWLIDSGNLPPTCRIRLTMSKPEGTDTYCWKPQEVQAIIEHCRNQEGLGWLGDVVTALACTGLRISELAALRWTDIDFETNVVHLTDESTRVPRRTREAREIKNRRSRSFPIHNDQLRVLRQIPRSGDGLVFHGPKGGLLKPDTVRRILIRDVLSPLAERFPAPDEEIGFADGRLHSFRHYFCSVCANQGVRERRCSCHGWATSTARWSGTTTTCTMKRPSAR